MLFGGTRAIFEAAVVRVGRRVGRRVPYPAVPSDEVDTERGELADMGKGRDGLADLLTGRNGTVRRTFFYKGILQNLES